MSVMHTPKQPRARPGPSHSLLNRAAVRRFVLDTLRRDRPYLPITRVSREALDTIEGWLREKVRAEVASHPTLGRTFKL